MRVEMMRWKSEVVDEQTLALYFQMFFFAGFVRNLYHLLGLGGVVDGSEGRSKIILYS